MITKIIIAIGAFIFGGWAAYAGTVVWAVGGFQGIRIPIVDSYYERKQIKENNKYNERILENHRDFFGEEPVVDWKE